ncbi:helix-turn-helix domain-containing protein [Niveispirillum cyanobacteriorum]|uniref:Uncharacterized protein n=1 Tax=Niveispirillum cyanobacteriorum TaxID=1612173 RepID=A0A2K9NLN2_9PROT|nr:helix-turn-helix domain-containing protein [Niveispirillum cyanobacteriorum]AUN33295.1 hypothetical protein C0V82_23270 [Niveispirillum cyanobacteriorum]GGE49897.1 hypothetical protein GCM10011317_05370 [Niveispirillum cyanobacteriorum]
MAKGTHVPQPELDLDLDLGQTKPVWGKPRPGPDRLDRLRRRDSLPLLPDTYQIILRLVGEERTISFIRRFGGTDARFPARPAPDHAMVRILGPENLRSLRREFGPLEIHWPAASDFLALVDARCLRRQGWSTRDIARRLYRDPKTIERYVKGMRLEKPQPMQAPLPLFDAQLP